MNSSAERVASIDLAHPLFLLLISPPVALTCNSQLKPCPNPKPNPSKANQNKPNKPTRPDSTRVRGTPSDHLWQQFCHLAQFSTNLPSLKGATRIGRSRGNGARGSPSGGFPGCPFGRRVDCMHVQAAGCELSLQLAMHIDTTPLAQWNEMGTK